MHLVNVSVMLIMLRTESAVMKIQLMFLCSFVTSQNVPLEMYTGAHVQHI